MTMGRRTSLVMLKIGLAIAGGISVRGSAGELVEVAQIRRVHARDGDERVGEQRYRRPAQTARRSAGTRPCASAGHSCAVLIDDVLLLDVQL